MSRLWNRKLTNRLFPTFNPRGPKHNDSAVICNYLCHQRRISFAHKEMDKPVFVGLKFATSVTSTSTDSHLSSLSLSLNELCKKKKTQQIITSNKGIDIFSPWCARSLSFFHHLYSCSVLTLSSLIDSLSL